MRLFERNGVLYADFKIKGKRFKRSLELADTPANRKYAIEKVLPFIGKEKKRYTLGEFLNIVLADAREQKPATAKIYESAIKQILNFFEPGTHMNDIKTADVDDFVRELKRSNLSANTINLYIVPLSLAFTEAQRLDIVSKNPVSLAKVPSPKPQKEKEIFDIKEMHAMLQNAKEMLSIFVHIGFYTGARAGEIIALKWNDIKDSKMTIARTRNRIGTLNLPKSGKTRTFKMPPPLEKFLATLERKNEWVLGKEFYSTQTLAKRFKKLQEELGIELKTPHAMRHTCISMLLAAGENPMLIKKMVGHVDMKMIESVYGHHIENERDFAGFTALMEQCKEHTHSKAA